MYAWGKGVLSLSVGALEAIGEGLRGWERALSSGESAVYVWVNGGYTNSSCTVAHVLRTEQR